MLKTIKQARAALSMLNPAEVRRLADHPVHFGLVASSDAAYRAMEEFLAPSNGRRLQMHRADNRDVPLFAGQAERRLHVARIDMAICMREGLEILFLSLSRMRRPPGAVLPIC